MIKKILYIYNNNKMIIIIIILKILKMNIILIKLKKNYKKQNNIHKI